MGFAKRCFFLFLCLAVIFIYTPVWAQSDLSELKEKMSAMEKEMGLMKQRIEQLEKEDKAKVSKIEDLKSQLEAQKAAPAYTLGEGYSPFGEGGLKVGGFGTVGLENAENDYSNFKLRAFHFYVQSPLGKDYSFYSETEYENGTKHTETSTEGELVQKRLWINWKINNWANLKIGKELNPVSGQWNLLYLHPLLPLYTKPLKQNRNRVPQDLVGAHFWGSVSPTSNLVMDYWLGAANGRGSRELSDRNENKMIFSRVQFTPQLAEKGNLKFGLAYANGQDDSLRNAKENTLAADLTYYLGKFGFWGEWFKSWVERSNRAPFHATSFFVLGQYKIMEKVAGVVRYEENDEDSTNKTANFREGKRWTFGLWYRPIVPVAYKLEYILHEEEKDQIANNMITGSVSFMF